MRKLPVILGFFALLDEISGEQLWPPIRSISRCILGLYEITRNNIFLSIIDARRPGSFLILIQVLIISKEFFARSRGQSIDLSFFPFDVILLSLNHLRLRNVNGVQLPRILNRPQNNELRQFSRYFLV